MRLAVVVAAFVVAITGGTALPVQASPLSNKDRGDIVLEVPPGKSVFTFSVGPDKGFMPAGAEAAGRSPICSGTGGYGVIKYQVCFQYNCDSSYCWVLGYFGLVNTASTSRAVSAKMDYAAASTNYVWGVDFGWDIVQLDGGEQQTVWGRISHHPICDATYYQRLTIQYGSAANSAPLTVYATLPCV